MSDKVRVHEIAKELGITSKEVVEKAQEMDVSIKTASSSVSMEEAEKIVNYIMNASSSAPASAPKKPVVKKREKKPEPPMPTTAVKEEPKPIKEEPSEEPTPTKSEESSKPNESAKEAPKVHHPIKKRTGLKIVKKKRPKPVEEEKPAAVAKAEEDKTKVSQYGSLSKDVLEELAKKKSKKHAAGPAEKKEHGKKLDIFGGDITDVSMDYEDEQVVLIDLNEVAYDTGKDDYDEVKPKPKPKPPGRSGGGANTGNRHRGNRQLSRDSKKKKYTKTKTTDEVITHVEIPEDIRVYEFAEKVNRPLADVIKALFTLGTMVTKNDFLGKDEIEILAEEFEVEVSTIDPKNAFNYEEEYEEKALEDENMVERPPVITVMGHVDHGKTSLLDAIRNAKVASGEAGGITQHIGAYTIEHNEKKITFVDTPGHEAFSNMRERGAEVTDIVIIVVAADDGVMPQTRESIKLAKEAKAPIIVAVNKMDKESANPDLVKGQMAELDLTPVDWGGDVEFVPISAKTGMGIDELLENILIQAELLELEANPDAMAKAVVIESSLEKGRGPVATVIVQNGTLNVGDSVVCGKAHGRIRTLIDDQKNQLKSITLSETAVVVGLNEVPGAGEMLIEMENEKAAREYAMKRAEYERHKELSKSTKTTLDELSSLIAEGKLKTLKVVLKTDVHGSLEAIRTTLETLRNDEVKVEVISSGVGGITENDVELVNNSENCLLLGFNVRPTGTVKSMAKQKGVDIKTYSIIYELIDDVTGLLTGMMSPKFSEEHTGQAEVRDTFRIPGGGMVAGCYVVDGKLVRGGHVRVIREGVVVHEGDLDSLKRFKDDVKEVGKGFECGVMVQGYEDIEVNDVIETFIRVEQKVTL